MPDWKPEIRRRLANLQLEPTREAAIIEELSQHLADGYAELLSGGATDAEAYQPLLSHGMWQEKFGGDTGVIGRKLLLSGEPHEVIGVLPQGFEYLSETG